MVSPHMTKRYVFFYIISDGLLIPKALSAAFEAFPAVSDALSAPTAPTKLRQALPALSEVFLVPMEALLASIKQRCLSVSGD